MRNKEKQNQYTREYKKRKREERLALGLCTVCGGPTLLNRAQCGCVKTEHCVDCNIPISKRQTRCTPCDRWKGGVHVTKAGYVTIYSREKKKRDYEHRIVMEGILGRALMRGESVHHKNGRRTDNRAENLELWVTFQPYGQRVTDLLQWAYTVIERYGP